MEDMTTEQHAEQIANSITNGQHKQAVTQFKRALQEDCSAFSLCEDINGQGIDTTAIIKQLCKIIEKE